MITLLISAQDKKTGSAVRDKNQLSENYEILFWKKGEYNPRVGQHGHSIVIIGAEKTKDGDFVYFIDANDTSKLGEKRRVYKISYDRLLSGLENIYTTSFTYDKISDPFLSRIEAMRLGYTKGPFGYFSKTTEKEVEEYKKVFQEAVSKVKP